MDSNSSFIIIADRTAPYLDVSMPITYRQTRTLNLYRQIMEEIRRRILAINMGTGNYLVTIPPPIVREFCYLQIRMICELIAYGCLLAHCDIEDARAPKLIREWSAEKIMKALEQLHPTFYPHAARQVNIPNGIHLEIINPHPLPKSELLHIYGQCGDVLHRGGVEKLMKSPDIPVIYAKITAIVQKFINWLSNCYLVTRDDKTVFYAIWEPNNRVTVAFASPPFDSP